MREKQDTYNGDNISTKIAALFKAHGDRVETGRRLMFLSKGWLTIVDEGESWFVLYTNGKYGHNSRKGPALGVDFEKSTGAAIEGPLFGADGEPVSENATLRDDVFRAVREHIEDAYRYHGGPEAAAS